MNLAAIPHRGGGFAELAYPGGQKGPFLHGWVGDRIPRITNRPVFAQMGMLCTSQAPVQGASCQKFPELAEVPGFFLSL